MMYDPPRTKSEAIRELLCQRRAHALHARYYRKLRFVMSVASIGAGTAAISAALQGHPALITTMAVIIALISIVDAVGGFAERQAQHNYWCTQFAKIEARSEQMTLAEIDAACADIDARIDIDALHAIAWHDTLRSVGYEEFVRPETPSQRLMRVLA